MVLRLAVAAVLAFDGTYAYVRTSETEMESRPASSEISKSDPVDRAIDEKLALRDQPEGIKPTDAAVLDDQGLKLGWPQIVGLIEIAFALTLLFGVLVRVAGLVGVGLIANAGLSVAGILGTCPYLTWVNDIYQSNPPAALLLGAICLSLLVSGAGPLSVDRLLFRRREPLSSPQKSA